MFDEIFFLRFRADSSFTAPRLMTIGVRRRAFDIPGVAHGDEHVRVGDQVFELDFVDLVHNLRAAIVAIRFVNFFQLRSDDGFQLAFAGEDFLQLDDQVANGFQFVENFVDGKLRQAVQLQFEDGVNLFVAEIKRAGPGGRFNFRGADEAVLAAVEFHAFELFRLAVFRDGDVLLAEILEQVFFRVRAAGRPADDANHVVQMVERDLVTDQNVFALFRFAQFEDRATTHDFHAVFDEELDERNQAELARLPADDREQNHAERFLHLRVLEEIVQDELRLFAALQLDDDAHAFTRGFIADIGNAFDLLVLDQFGDALDELGLVHLVRNFSDDDIFAILAGFLDGGFRAHGKAAAAIFVSGFDAFAAGNVRAGRKIRAGNDLHHFLERCVRFFDEQNCGVHDFAQVVRRNVRRHTDGDAARAVNQQIRDARRENDRLFAGLVEVRNEINGLFFEVGENVFGNFGEPRFGVPHGGWRIAVHGAEISLTVNQGVAHVEVLRETHQRGINHCFAVRVIVAGSVAADFCAFAVAAIRGKTEIVHRDQNAALHRLEAVANVGKGTRDDDAHRVVEIRLPHFRFDINRKQH